MIAGDERGETILRESLDTALAHDLQEHVARAYTNLGATLVKHRRYAAGEDVLQAGIAFCADRDLDSWTSYMRGTLSILLLETGRWAEARSLAHAAATAVRGDRQQCQRASWCWAGSGPAPARDPTAAAEAWKVAEPSGEAQRVLICAAGLAEAAWTRDDPDDVRRRVDAVWALAVERGGPWYLGELLWWLHCAGERRAAPQPVAEPFALMVAGDAAAAAASWDAIGNPFWAALARAASDDPDDLRAATTGFEALGATATHAAVVRDLRRRRTPVPRGPRAASRANPAGLTEREMEVLLRARRGSVQRRDRRPLRPVGEDGRAPRVGGAAQAAGALALARGRHRPADGSDRPGVGRGPRARRQRCRADRPRAGPWPGRCPWAGRREARWRPRCGRSDGGRRPAAGRRRKLHHMLRS